MLEKYFSASIKTDTTCTFLDKQNSTTDYTTINTNNKAIIFPYRHLIKFAIEISY